LLLCFCPLVVVVPEDQRRGRPDGPVPPVTIGNDRDRVDADTLGDPRLFLELRLIGEPFG